MKKIFHADTIGPDHYRAVIAEFFRFNKHWSSLPDKVKGKCMEQNTRCEWCELIKQDSVQPGRLSLLVSKQLDHLSFGTLLGILAWLAESPAMAPAPQSDLHSFARFGIRKEKAPDHAKRG